jgi:hypothetical protein
VSKPIVLSAHNNAIAAIVVGMQLESGLSGKRGGSTGGRARASAAVRNRVFDTASVRGKNEKGSLWVWARVIVVNFF